VALSCLVRITHFGYKEKVIDQACSVNMAGYRRLSVFLHVYGSQLNVQKKNLANIQPS